MSDIFDYQPEDKLEYKEVEGGIYDFLSEYEEDISNYDVDLFLGAPTEEEYLEEEAHKLQKEIFYKKSD